MIRCKPLLGTYVEISIDDACGNHIAAIEQAFNAIATVQKLMGFHDPNSELSMINSHAHLNELEIHPWTSEVLQIAREVYSLSGGLFNCGIGHHLVASGLLPTQINQQVRQYGGIEDLQWITTNKIFSTKPLCLDLGGIAKGFAVDIAVQCLRTSGVESGSVNAGGDLRVFGNQAQTIYLREPSKPNQVINIGELQNGAIATSGLYLSAREKNTVSHFINPISGQAVDTPHSYSVIANECIYADALTKVLALTHQPDHACFNHFSAQAIQLTI